MIQKITTIIRKNLNKVKRCKTVQTLLIPKNKNEIFKNCFSFLASCTKELTQKTAGNHDLKSQELLQKNLFSL